MSMGGRRSSVAPGRKIADPRQINDKGFKDRAVRKLIQYLMQNGYERTLSPQLLTAPSTKDFVYIISFLLKAAVPNFEFGRDSKFEEEVPSILKVLGYPYHISKSALTSVGAPHAWPPILAALAWLVDLIKYSEKSSADASGSFDDGNIMFFDYLRQGYTLFLAGEDDLSSLEESIAFTFESKNAGLHKDIASLTSANEELSKQHHELTDGDTPLQRAQAHNTDLQSDTAKFEKHIADLHEHRAKVSDKLASESAEKAERTAELGNLTTEVAQHKETVAGQEMTSTDARRMQDERKHLESEFVALQTQKDALSKQLWNDELNLSKTIDRLEVKIQQVNNCSLRLHLIPADSKNARGVSYKMVLDKSMLETDADTLLSIDTRGVMMPGLLDVKASVNVKVAEAQERLLSSDEDISRREDDVAERGEQLANLKAALAKLERQEKNLRDEHSRELSDMKAQTEELEEQIRLGRSVTGQSVATSTAELASVQASLDETTETAARTREKVYSQLVSSLDMLTLHKETVETALKGLKEHCAAKMEQLAPLLDEAAP